MVVHAFVLSRINVENGQKNRFLAVQRARVVSSKEEGYSVRKSFVNLGYSETTVSTFVSCFTKLGNFGDEKKTGLAKKNRRKITL